MAASGSPKRETPLERKINHEGHEELFRHERTFAPVCVFLFRAAPYSLKHLDEADNIIFYSTIITYYRLPAESGYLKT